MSIKEQLEIKALYHTEAMRYMSNAKTTLIEAGKEGKFYKDDKYVKTACGIAYNGVLKALDGYFVLKGIKTDKRRKSIEYYQSHISKLDHKLNTELGNAYKILHVKDL